MAQIITAPSNEIPIYPSVFLAGGITNCKEWQNDVINNLMDYDISIYNPRQEHFDIADPNGAEKQIKWEFDRLESADIFSMYFCNDNSDQPICMYELGRNLVRMQNRFPNDWKRRIVISVEEGYRRAKDVSIQTQLHCPELFVDTIATPERHAKRIVDSYLYLNKE